MFTYRLFSSVFLLGFLFFIFIFDHNNIALFIFILFGYTTIVYLILELYTILKKIDIYIYYLPNTLFTLLLFTINFIFHDYFLKVNIIIFFLTMFAVYFALLAANDKQNVLKQFCSFYLIQILVVIPINFLILIYFYDCSAYKYEKTLGVILFVYILLITKIGDIGAYLTGMSLRKIGMHHKFFPKISPNKSIEGVVGAFIFNVSFSFLLSSVFNFNIFNAIFIGIIICFFGIFGDLIVSAIKRIAQQKDSGMILPGIGGVLDFIDSLITTVPIFYFLIPFLIN